MKVPVGETGVSGGTPELPQHIGVVEEGREGKALCAAVTLLWTAAGRLIQNMDFAL